MYCCREHICLFSILCVNFFTMTHHGVEFLDSKAIIVLLYQEMKPFSRMCITISVLSSNTQNLASIPSMSTLCTNQFSNYFAIQYCNILSFCCQACSSLYANKCEYFLIDLSSFSFTVNFYLPPSSDLLFGLVCGFLRILP